MNTGQVRDLSGQIFGNWTVTDQWKREDGVTYWWCECACGDTSKWVAASALTAGLSQSCGCRYNPIVDHLEDWKQKQFGKLRIIDFAGRDGQKAVLWRCRCECGNETTVRHRNLVGGNTKSCGCGRVKMIKFRDIQLRQKDWAQHIGLNGTTLGNRLRHGWSIEETLTTPPKKPKGVYSDLSWWKHTLDEISRCAVE